MTIEDALTTWMATHQLKFLSGGFSKLIGSSFKSIGCTTTLSNHMHLSYYLDGYVQITGSLSKKSYKAHISDPQLFPILDRALDEEDKWIRDGHRSPE